MCKQDVIATLIVMVLNVLAVLTFIYVLRTNAEIKQINDDASKIRDEISAIHKTMINLRN